MPMIATIAAPISINFSRSATIALSNLSAISPPTAEKNKNGRIRTALAIVTIEAAWLADN